MKFWKLIAKQCLKHTHYSWSILTILWVTNSIMLPNTHYGFVQKLCLRIYASFGVSLHSSVTEQKYIISCLCTGRMLIRCQVLLQSILATALSDVGQGGVHILTEGLLKQWWGWMDTRSSRKWRAWGWIQPWTMPASSFHNCPWREEQEGSRAT